MIDPKDLNDMQSLRAEIDRCDAELIAKFADRHALISRAAELKAENGLPANIPARVEEVVANAREHAAMNGLDPDLIENIWRQLISAAIAQEEAHLNGDTE